MSASNIHKLPRIPSLSWDDCRLLVESVVDYAIFMLDPQGLVATWNIGAEKIKGYAASEIVGQHFSKFYPAEDVQAGKPERELEIAKQVGRVEDEGWRIRKDGSRFWASVIITPLRDERGELRGFGKVTRDLTERRQAEELERQLLREQAALEVAREAERFQERAARAAEQASRSKDEFLATVSHELRTPLNAILGWSKLLKDRVMDAGLAKPIAVIYRNAQAQVKIIDDILDVSRVISGKFKLEAKPADLVTIARDAIDVIGPSAIAKAIDIRFTPEQDYCLLVADPERLQQVVWNLLSNAVKFTDPGGTIAVRLRQEGPNVVLTVTDNGAGIDPAFLPFVFDRFRQADSSITRRVSGLGLGLSLVRHIIELHGGRVSVASQGLGHGATFTTTIPIRGALSSDPSPPTNVSDATALAELTGVRVLVVDDEPDARDIVAEILSEQGAVVETARSATEGFEAFERFRPDVLVSDIGMPGEDGYSLMRRIRTHSPEGGRVPSLALTAFASGDDRERAVEAGYTMHMGKPASVGTLTAAVASLAAVRQASRVTAD